VRTRHKVSIWVLSTALAAAIVCALWPRREPMHNGQALHYWVAILGVSASQGGEFEKAVDAVTEAGTNALPFLVQWIQYEPSQSSRLREKVAEFADVVIASMTPQSHKPRTAPHRGRGRLADGAEVAFQFLGNKATAAVPKLISLMNNPSAPETAARATLALGYLGTNALPPLLAVIDNPTHHCHHVALLTIAHMSPSLSSSSDTIVPHLIRCLSDTNNPGVASLAAICLGQLHSAPHLAVPALAACLNSTNDALQFQAAKALGRFGTAATCAVPALTAALESTDQRLSNLASNALLHIAPEVLTNTPGE
jgi:hypothetical protein